jgi:hypothetical protein
MKRSLGAGVLVSVVMCWTVFAEATSLSIFPDPLVGIPGDTVPTSVEYTAQGAQVTALEFEVLYDPSFLTLSGQAGSAATLASKVIAFGGLAGDSIILISGLNQNVIGDGSVADLKFQVSLNAPAGPYNFSLSHISGSDAFGNLVTITNLGPPPNGAVPEPSTWLLLGTGLAGLAAWCARHGRQGRRSLHDNI